MADFRLVQVEWVDSYGAGQSWQEMDELEPKLLVVKSAGWLVHESKDLIVLVPHISERLSVSVPSQGCGEMTIPKSAIKSIVSLSRRIRTKREKR